MAFSVAAALRRLEVLRGLRHLTLLGTPYDAAQVRCRMGWCHARCDEAG